MAIQVIYNAAITVNGVDLSSRLYSLKVNFGQELKEKTAMGDVAKNFLPSLAAPTIEATFYIDRASGSVVQTIRPLVSVTQANFPVTCRWVNSAATTSNEVYTMTSCLSGGLDVISGAVGDVEKTTVKFACGSGTGIAVATTS